MELPNTGSVNIFTV